jgi:hypothetical protein
MLIEEDLFRSAPNTKALTMEDQQEESSIVVKHHP